MKSAILVIIALAFFFQTVAKAQTYSLESLDGAKVKLDLCDTILRGRTLAISYLKDTVHTECWGGLQSVKIVDRKFLQIVCGVRGGSGLELKSTTILAVTKGKLCVCLTALCYAKGVDVGYEGGFKTSFTISGNQKSNYKTIAHIYDQKTYYRKPKNGYRRNTTTVLRFDPILNIFYTGQKQISKQFEGGDDSGPRVKQKAVSGKFPLIDLNGDKYYFIKGHWYKDGLENILYLQ